MLNDILTQKKFVLYLIYVIIQHKLNINGKVLSDETKRQINKLFYKQNIQVKYVKHVRFIIDNKILLYETNKTKFCGSNFTKCKINETLRELVVYLQLSNHLFYSFLTS